MARKSRKNTISSNNDDIFMPQYNVGIYARLSVEDIRKKESDSIGTQRRLLVAFAERLENARLIDLYADINQTGTNFERPEFNRLMVDVKSGKINCIVVKDLSRFGRNYIETGNYLEKVFPFMGVRFISVNDNYDSSFAQTEDCMVVPLKNLMNDFYSRDISKKITSQYAIKRKKGEFCGCFAPYGYIKDGKELIVDEESANIVKFIFDLVLQGLSDTAICQKLNDMEIMPPSRYRYEKGILKAKKYQDTKYWHTSAIKRITENPTYLGDLIQGRYRSNFLSESRQNGRRTILAKKENWVTVTNTHEAIISQEVYEQVQRIRIERKESNQQLLKNSNRPKSTENILKGLVYCHECGSSMIRHKAARKNSDYDYRYLCNIYEKVNKNACSKKSFLESELIKIIYEQLKTQIDCATQVYSIIEEIRKQENYSKRQTQLELDIITLNKEIVQVALRQSRLYEDYVMGILDEDGYLFAKQDYEKKHQELILLKETFVSKQIGENKDYGFENKWLKEYSRFSKSKKLTKEMVQALVEKILIKSDREVEIVLKYADEFERISEYMKREYKGVAI